METKSEKSASTRPPQNEGQHPGEWEGDLNPQRGAGQNVGEFSSEQEQALPTAYDVKPAHRAFREQFEDDDLKQIPIVPEGQRLQQGAIYVDLADPERREFRATGDIAADGSRWYVPKDRVPYPIWNRLTGVRNPDRLDEDTGRTDT
jgi:hypothetical protein